MARVNWVGKNLMAGICPESPSKWILLNLGGEGGESLALRKQGDWGGHADRITLLDHMKIFDKGLAAKGKATVPSLVKKDVNKDAMPQAGAGSVVNHRATATDTAQPSGVTDIGSAGGGVTVASTAQLSIGAIGVAGSHQDNAVKALASMGKKGPAESSSEGVVVKVEKGDVKLAVEKNKDGVVGPSQETSTVRPVVVKMEKTVVEGLTGKTREGAIASRSPLDALAAQSSQRAQPLLRAKEEPLVDSDISSGMKRSAPAGGLGEAAGPLIKKARLDGGARQAVGPVATSKFSGTGSREAISMPHVTEVKPMVLVMDDYRIADNKGILGSLFRLSCLKEDGTCADEQVANHQHNTGVRMKMVLTGKVTDSYSMNIELPGSVADSDRTVDIVGWKMIAVGKETFALHVRTLGDRWMQLGRPHESFLAMMRPFSILSDALKSLRRNPDASRDQAMENLKAVFSLSGEEMDCLKYLLKVACAKGDMSEISKILSEGNAKELMASTETSRLKSTPREGPSTEPHRSSAAASQATYNAVLTAAAATSAPPGFGPAVPPSPTPALSSATSAPADDVAATSTPRRPPGFAAGGELADKAAPVGCSPYPKFEGEANEKGGGDDEETDKAEEEEDEYAMDKDLAADLRMDPDEEFKASLGDDVCYICDDGGNLLMCDGPCMRCFHGSPVVDEETGTVLCQGLGMDESLIEYCKKEVLGLECANCLAKQQQCFVCGQLGAFDDENKEVLRCERALCCRFYHPKCVAEAILEVRKGERRNSLPSTNADELASLFRSGTELLICPLHFCCECQEEETGKEEEFFKCRRCPRAYHGKCLPSDLHVRDEGPGMPQRVWGFVDEEPDLAQICYCRRHEIDEQLRTPRRDHLKWPHVPGVKNPQFGSYAEIVDRLLAATNILEEAYAREPIPEPGEVGPASEPSPFKPATPVPTPAKTEKKRLSVAEIMAKAKARVSREDILEKLNCPTCYAHSDGHSNDLTEAKLKSIFAAVERASMVLKQTGDTAKARNICPKEYLINLDSTYSMLRVSLAPFIHGRRYTSFGRHFTVRAKLTIVAERLQPYIKDGDAILDFCCGANEWSREMETVLKKKGKPKCQFKNFDILPPADTFNFKWKDWFKVGSSDVPFKGEDLIMGLNPPFGVRASLANQFIQHAIKFRPKLLCLIVPPETKPLDTYGYDLIWEDDKLLGGHAFYLPGSADERGNTMSQWNNTPPPLYLWSRKDWTERHREIALANNHIRIIPNPPPPPPQMEYLPPMHMGAHQGMPMHHNQLLSEPQHMGHLGPPPHVGLVGPTAPDYEVSRYDMEQRHRLAARAQAGTLHPPPPPPPPPIGQLYPPHKPYPDQLRPGTQPEGGYGYGHQPPQHMQAHVYQHVARHTEPVQEPAYNQHTAGGRVAEPPPPEPYYDHHAARRADPIQDGYHNPRRADPLEDYQNPRRADPMEDYHIPRRADPLEDYHNRRRADPIQDGYHNARGGRGGNRGSPGYQARGGRGSDAGRGVGDGWGYERARSPPGGSHGNVGFDQFRGGRGGYHSSGNQQDRREGRYGRGRGSPNRGRSRPYGR